MGQTLPAKCATSKAIHTRLKAGIKLTAGTMRVAIPFRTEKEREIAEKWLSGKKWSKLIQVEIREKL